MKIKSQLLGLIFIGSLFFQGCFTQLAMFYPEPEIEEFEEQFYDTYSQAPSRPGLDVYAQDGAGTPLGLAYSSMYERFYGMYPYFGASYGSGYYNKYDYYNRYGYHPGAGGYTNLYGYNGYDYVIGGYKMFVPINDNKELRSFNKDRTLTSGTNLNVNRSSSSSRTNQSSHGGNSSSVSSDRSSGSSYSGSSSSSSSSSSSGGRRASRRN